MTAIRALALALAAFAVAPAAHAGLRLTFIEYDSTFTTSLGGYQVTSNFSAPTDSIQFLFGTGGNSGAGNSLGSTLATINAANGAAPNFSGMTITSTATSRQFSDYSELVDSETEAKSNAGPGPARPRYFEIVMEQDLYTQPDSALLAFNISHNTLGGAGNPTQNATAQYRATLTTEEGPPATSATLPVVGFLSAAAGAPVATVGPAYVANPSTGYRLTSTMRLSFTQGTGRITTTGSASVAAAPEPGMFATAVVGIGLLGGAGWLRRRRKAD